eukprot:4708106-Amphidinium_carterae.1
MPAICVQFSPFLLIVSWVKAKALYADQLEQLRDHLSTPPLPSPFLRQKTSSTPLDRCVHDPRGVSVSLVVEAKWKTVEAGMRTVLMWSDLLSGHTH